MGQRTSPLTPAIAARFLVWYGS